MDNINFNLSKSGIVVRTNTQRKLASRQSARARSIENPADAGAKASLRSTT